MTLQTTTNVTALHPEQPDTHPVQPTLWNQVEPWHEPVGSGIFDEIEQDVLKLTVISITLMMVSFYLSG